MVHERLTRLIAAGARRAERRVTLDEALLSDRGAAYAWYRTRLLALRIPVGIVLHVAELYAFADAYDLDIIGPMLGLRSLSALGLSLWWGALEDLRSQVRTSAQLGEWGRAERTIRAHLALAVDAALLALALAVASVMFLPSHFGGFDIFNAYALSCALRFGLEAIGRTYHAGIFAVRRVHRPGFSVFLPDVLELGLALGLWPVLGPWGFSLSLLFGGALNAGTTIWYSRLAYREQGNLSPRWFAIGRARADVSAARLLTLGRHALANLTTHVDAALILLLSYGLPERGAERFVLLLHALRPLLGAASSVGRTFYFDFKQLSLGQIAFFRQRLARLVRRTAWVVALLAAVLAAAADYWLGERRLSVELGLVVAYTVARSLLSVEQLRLFTLERYGVLALGSVALLAALGLACALFKVGTPLVIATVALVGLLVWGFKLSADAHDADVTAKDQVIGPYRWLYELSRQRAQVLAGTLRFDRKLTTSPSALLQQLCRALPQASFARIGTQQWVFWQTLSDSTPALESALLAASGGALAELHVSAPLVIDARALLETTWLTSWADAASATTASALEQDFRREFPNGDVLSLRASPPRRFFGAGRTTAAALHAIYASCFGAPRARTPDALQVAVLCPRGEPLTVFFAPAGTTPQRFLEFRRKVHATSVALSIE